jgi:mono/diheme cytochrome c family protein
MIKKLSFFCFVVVMLVLAVPLFLYPPSYTADGETFFNLRCGLCHKSKGGEAPAFAPVKYASSQWERFFSKNKHQRKKDISAEVSPEEIELIKQYLMKHAADSDRPIAAGLK